MSLKVNEWTRVHDDKCRYNYEINASKRPLRYITNDIQDHPDEQMHLGYYTTPTHVASDVVNKSSGLRPQMTHKNEIQLLEAPVFPNMPYMGSGELLGQDNYININSDLRGDSTRLTEPAGKAQVEHYTPGYLQNDPQKGAVLPDNWIVGGRSSRNDMRELYKEICH